jgi:hypothetical protein
MTLSDFAGEASAMRLKNENSWVAFDMLMETNTMLPCGDGLPSASSVWMRASCASAALRNASGAVFSPPP